MDKVSFQIHVRDGNATQHGWGLGYHLQPELNSIALAGDGQDLADNLFTCQLVAFSFSSGHLHGLRHILFLRGHQSY